MKGLIQYAQSRETHQHLANAYGSPYKSRIPEQSPSCMRPRSQTCHLLILIKCALVGVNFEELVYSCMQRYSFYSFD